ncbi:MAG: S8 family serine peptidase [Planctomycetota bacterium]
MRRSSLLPSAPLLALVLALGFPLGACGGGGGGGGGSAPPGGGGGQPAGAVQGTLSVLLPDATVLEAEPNDSVEQAHALGEFRSGAELRVLGNVTEAGADQVDGFQLVAPDRVRVDVRLTATAPGADLDLLVFDPVSLQPVERFLTDGAVPEVGSFVASGSFFLAVDSFSGDSDYELEISVQSLTGPIDEREPNDRAQDGVYLGTLLPGQQVSVTGDGLSGTDFVLFAVPEATPVALSCAFGLGDDYDLIVYDVTEDFADPQEVVRFEAPGLVNPETGQINVSAMTLVAVEVLAFSGVSPWQLTIATPSPLTTAGGPGAFAPRSMSTRSRGSLASQRTLLRAASDAPMFAVAAAPSMRGDLVVQLDDETDEAIVQPFVAAHGGTVLASIPGGPKKVRFAIPDDLSPTEAARYQVALAATLRGRAGVRIAEPDYRLEAFQAEVRPNDEFYNLQWHYEQIQLPAAWAITTGSNAVRVAVLDTGSAPATDLVPRTVPGFDMISDPANAGDGDGIDADPTDVGDSNGVQPSSFHGAHVAGTIGAATNTGDQFGVAGVTWQTQVFHVRVLGLQGGSNFDILNAVRYAAGLSSTAPSPANPPADIQNLSLGGPAFSQPFQDAVTAATQAGCLIVAAAGNENSSTPSFPAAYDDVVSVAAVDFERQRAPYSNFHPSVDIAAPGGDVTVDRNGDNFGDGVLSTKPDDTVNPTNFDSFAFNQGTSMAAPHVAGVAALLLSVAPGLTPAQLEQILTSTATDLGAPGRDDQYGHGLVNALAAVQNAGGGTGGGPSISLAASSVLFDTAVDTKRVGVLNAGGGTLQVMDPIATTTSGGNWLSAARVAIASPTTSDTSAIDVDVSAAGLANGIYGGSVRVESNGGIVTLGVSLAIGQNGNAPDYEVFVLAVEPTELETLAQAIVRTQGALSYTLPSLPTGSYLVVAGTDEDGDGFICDPGEPLCGVFPSLELATLVPVEDGQTVAGVDFPLETSTLPASAGGGSGYRILRPAASFGAPARTRGLLLSGTRR